MFVSAAAASRGSVRHAKRPRSRGFLVPNAEESGPLVSVDASLLFFLFRRRGWFSAPGFRRRARRRTPSRLASVSRHVFSRASSAGDGASQRVQRRFQSVPRRLGLRRVVSVRVQRLLQRRRRDSVLDDGEVPFHGDVPAASSKHHGSIRARHGVAKQTQRANLRLERRDAGFRFGHARRGFRARRARLRAESRGVAPPTKETKSRAEGDATKGGVRASLGERPPAFGGDAPTRRLRRRRRQSTRRFARLVATRRAFGLERVAKRRHLRRQTRR